MNPFERWLSKARSYKAVFGADELSRTPAQKEVLADLAKLCNAQKPSLRFADGKIDVHATMVSEGRREVFLRIIGQCNITEQQIYQYMQAAEGRINND